MSTFRVSASVDGSSLIKVLKNATLAEAERRVVGEIRFLSLMPLNIPNREVEWSIEMKGSGEEWHTILSGRAIAR